MRDGIGKCFQFLIAGLQLAAPLLEIFVERANVSVPAPALGDVIVGAQDRNRPAPRVALKRPSARYRHRCSVGPLAVELAFPAAGTQQLRANLIERHRKDRLQEVVSMLAERFLWPQAVQLLGSAIPVGDDVAHVTDEDGVMREIQEAGLLRSLRHFFRELVTRFQKAANEQGKEEEDDKVREVSGSNGETVYRFDEKVVVCQKSENNREESRPVPGKPDGQGNGK